MERLKNTTNMWRYREGYIQDNDDGEWVGLDKDEKTIVTTKRSMADVKSALDVIFDKKKKVKKPAKKKGSLKGKPVTHLANMLDAHICGPNRFKR